MCSTTASGVACCGNCRGELKIVCENGCELPDPIFKSDPIATMRRPRAFKNGRATALHSQYPTGRKFLPGICTYRDCPDPIAPRTPGARGRPHTKCVKHLEDARRWNRSHRENVLARNHTNG